MATSNDIEQSNPLLQVTGPRRRPLKVLATTLVSFLLLASLVALFINEQPSSSNHPAESAATMQGVSEKGFSRIGSGSAIRDENGSFAWTNAMLAWQRTCYHFQPQKNWMNDPNGPLYHMGWYHLFYQYNPDSAIWGNITWGHAVSRDMINWLYLPLAMVPDQSYDWNGVWTGSATHLPNGDIVMLYTGDTDNYVQVQNLAYPADLTDPLLLNWLKYPDNPVMTPPRGIGLKDFRDPTTAWLGPDGLWRVLVGSKKNSTGIALVYKTSNFTTFDLIEDHVLHEVPGTGMWECVDFYPVSTTTGLDTSDIQPGVKHVLKASLDDDKHDWYALGTFDAVNDTWTPDNPVYDLGIGLRVDYGKYYASKTFYDQNKERRILWGWVGETDSEDTDLEKGWASIQTIPRVVTLDNETGTNIIQWPIEEVESLRSTSYEFSDVLVEAGSVVNLEIGAASQLDVSAEFVINAEALNNTVEADVINNCTTTTSRGVLGPFGLLVLTDESLSELTPVYFYIAKSTDGTVVNWFCTDQSRSSKAPDVNVQVYGGPVPVLDGEQYTMRLLVDHSVVEAFAQGGRTTITSRIYPTEAIYGNATLFLFNNATELNVTASVKVWEMKSTHFEPFPLDTKM